MLKPNYHRKEKNANYKIGYGFGNMHFDELKSRGIIAYYVNGYIIRFVPKYDEDLFDFPPNKERLENISVRDREFKSMDEHRYWSFYDSDLVFYVSDEKRGELIVREYFEEGKSNIPRCVIQCITQEEYAPIYKEVKTFPYLYPHLPVHVRRSHLLKTKIIQFLDKHLENLKAVINDDFRESVFT